MSFDDLNEIITIENDSFPRPWPKSQFIRELVNPISFSFVCKVLKNGKLRVAAYIIFWLVLDEAHILNLAVHTSCRRQGIATHLMVFALAKMKEMGVKDVFLEVRVSNMPGRRLYKHMGFRKVDTRKGYYENGEDAIVMHCDLR